MIGAAATEQSGNKIPLSLSRLSPAVDKTGRQVAVDDKTGRLGGELNLPKDLPESSFVVVLFDLATGVREKKEFHVARNFGKGIELDQNGIPQIIDLMVNEKIPISNGTKRDQSVVSFGEELSFATMDDSVHCASLNLPMGKNLTSGEVVVITPRMLANYKKSLGF